MTNIHITDSSIKIDIDENNKVFANKNQLIVILRDTHVFIKIDESYESGFTFDQVLVNGLSSESNAALFEKLTQ